MEVKWYKYATCSCGAAEGEPCINRIVDQRSLDRYLKNPHSWRKLKKVK